MIGCVCNISISICLSVYLKVHVDLYKVLTWTLDEGHEGSKMLSLCEFQVSSYESFPMGA